MYVLTADTVLRVLTDMLGRGMSVDLSCSMFVIIYSKCLRTLKAYGVVVLPCFKHRIFLLINKNKRRTTQSSSSSSLLHKFECQNE